MAPKLARRSHLARERFDRDPAPLASVLVRRAPKHLSQAEAPASDMATTQVTRFVHRAQVAFLAGAVVFGPLAILVAAVANPPYYGSTPGEATAVATNASS